MYFIHNNEYAVSVRDNVHMIIVVFVVVGGGGGDVVGVAVVVGNVVDAVDVAVGGRPHAGTEHARHAVRHRHK